MSNMKVTKPPSDETFPPPSAGPRYAPSKRIVMGTSKVIRKVKPIALSPPYNSRVGRLKIGGYVSDVKCRITCDCGHSGMKDNAVVLKLLSQGMGCGTANCTIDSLDRLLWLDVDNSLRLQLFLLVQFFPEEVPSRWGGAMDDFESLELDQGYANFVADELRGEPLSSVRWIERETTELPFIPGNIVLATAPSDLLARGSEEDIDVGAGKMQLSEIMKFTGKTESEVLLKAFELRTFDGVLTELL